MQKERGDQDGLGLEVKLTGQQEDKHHVAHEFVGRRADPRCFAGIDPGGDAKNDRTGCDRARGNDEAAEMRANRQGQDDMSDRVANVVEVSAEPAFDVQLGGQNAVQIVHDVVEHNQRDQVSVAIVQKENDERQDAEKRRHVSQISVYEVSLRMCHR